MAQAMAMSETSPREYTEKMRGRYGRLTGKPARIRLVDEYVEITGYEHKYAIKVLRGTRRREGGGRRGSPKRYDEAADRSLRRLWLAMDQPCGKRMKDMLPLWLDHSGEKPAMRKRLLSMLEKRCRRHSLHAAAAQSSELARVTIHGWAEIASMTKLMRREGMVTMSAFGCLLEYPNLCPEFLHLGEPGESYLEFLKAALWTRLRQGYCFTPKPLIAGILDAGVKEQQKLAGMTGMPVEIANPVPMLPWNIAALLWAIGWNTDQIPENSPLSAKRACRIAQFIHQLTFTPYAGSSPLMRRETVILWTRRSSTNYQCGH